MSGLNFLTESHISVLISGKRIKMSISEILSKLSEADEIESICFLRPHQKHAFYSFLCQLGAIAMNHTYETKIPQSKSAWEELVLGISSHAAWHLINNNLDEPALLQPPIPKKAQNHWEKKAKRIDSADEIDILVTSKNHDVKRFSLYQASPEHWFFALLTAQTMDGYCGSKNYGIVRMNGGHGNRSCVTRIPSLSMGQRFRRDINVLLESRPEITQKYQFMHKRGEALLWLIPWAGEEDEMLKIGDLDPYFIEICKRIRLGINNGNIVAYKCGSKKRRIDDENRKGVVGDPWSPIVLKREKTKESQSKDAQKNTGIAYPEKVLTVSRPGFDYKMIYRLMFDENIEHSIMQRPHAMDGKNPMLYMWAMARGQGETDGIYERMVPIPEEIFAAIDNKESKWDKMSSFAMERIEEAVVIQNEILKPSLMFALQSAPSKINFKDVRVKVWINQMDEDIDKIFWTRMWTHFALNEEEAYSLWIKELLGMAEKILFQAFAEIPMSSCKKYKSMASAHNMFQGRSRNYYPEAFENDLAPWRKLEKGKVAIPYEDDIDRAVCDISTSFFGEFQKEQKRKGKMLRLRKSGNEELFRIVHSKCLTKDSLMEFSDAERKWHSIISILAILGRYHDRFKPSGYAMGLVQYPEQRVMALLDSRGENLIHASRLLAKFLAERQQRVSFSDIARMILDEDDQEIRLKVASSYYYEVTKKRRKESERKEKNDCA